MPALNPWLSVISGVALLIAPWPATAQITPDTTLGTEGSVMLPGVEIGGTQADLIEGGAIRGENLFHSFLEFNIDPGQRVYFANPAGIESILSRITGGNPSNIFGTLGVNGAADLFLINPNGIVFGETAALDIQGSFYASTAEAIPLGKGVYSATAPEQSSLLTVNPSALFSSYLTDASGDIENRGQLAAQGNMTLAANNLDLQGQVAAGGDLTLLGNTVQIRDAVDTPFVGFAGGDLLVQGNEGVDIVALSHPDSGLYAYGDMVLRSANPVGGDAHYWSGGSFRVEGLSGDVGALFSPVDPIIRALGDVFIEDYLGSSLHILAGGSVTIGTAEITAPDPGTIGIDFLQETIALSDGTIVQIDGAAQPTLDVRAGVNPAALGTPPLEVLTGFNPVTDTFFGEAFTTETPSTADITVGDVLITAPNGLVLLTNQYQTNTTLAGGNIIVTGAGIYGNGIDARGFGQQGGAVYLDARNDVSVTDSRIQTSGAGVVGDVVINAANTSRFNRQNRPTGVVSNLAAGTEGTGGNIRITANHIEVLNEAQLSASTSGTGDAGNVVINARDRVLFDNSDAFSDVGAGAIGTGGNVEITTNSLEVTNGAQLSASTSGRGSAGNVVITARDRVVFSGASASGAFRSAAFSRVEAGAEGAGGNVEIITNALEVTDRALLSASTFGTGDAGNVMITAQDRVIFDGTSADGMFRSAAFSTVEAGAEGAGGNVVITANSLAVTNGAQLSASTFSTGDAGNVVIMGHDLVLFDGRSTDSGVSSAAASTVQAGATGAGGNVEITTHALEVMHGAQLLASTWGKGNAGNVVITASDRVVFAGVSTDGQFSSAAFSSIEAGATGAGGNVVIDANTLEVLNGAQLQASTRGNGDAGNVEITTRDRAVFAGTSTNGQLVSAAFSRVGAGATGAGGNVVIDTNILEVLDEAQLSANTIGNGDAGNVEITTNTLEVLNGAQLIVNTRGAGNAGNVEITARDRVVFAGISADGQFSSAAFSSVEEGVTGAGGNVVIDTNTLEVLNGAQLISSTSGTGDAGNVEITARDRVVFAGTSADGSFVSAAFSRVGGGGNGDAGNVVIDTNTLEVLNGAQLSANTLGNGDAGNVEITARDRVVFAGTSADGPFVSAALSSVGAGATGAGGNVVIDTNTLEVLNGAQLISSTSGTGDAGNVEITARNRVVFVGSSADGQFSSGVLTNNTDRSSGQSNNIQITAPQLLVQDGAVLLATTRNNQPGGDIILSLGRLEVLNGGQVVTGSLGSGPAGTIRVDAPEGIVIAGSDPNFAARVAQFPDTALLVIPQSALSVRSSGEGVAGSIVIGGLGTTPRLDLDAGGQIIAESAAVDGGNISITLNDLLFMQNGSLISTTAGTAQAGGNGGNITISVPFIIAIPAENSDIAADAFEGTGGNVNITARGIFGIAPRPQRTPLSDITATSELGVSGVVFLNTLDTSFIEGSLSNLADTIVDTAALTAGSCIARTEESLGSFTVTGSGGLPQRPGEGSIAAFPTGVVRTGESGTSLSSMHPTEGEIVEPDGVYQLPDGRLVLSRACE